MYFVELSDRPDAIDGPPYSEAATRSWTGWVMTPAPIDVVREMAAARIASGPWLAYRIFRTETTGPLGLLVEEAARVPER